jgi:DNA polymerase-3 subunit delta'
VLGQSSTGHSELQDGSGQPESRGNWGLLGHEWAVEFLRSGLAQGRTAHAYLFTGPDKIGKRTLALALARSINCESSPGESSLPLQPCGECLSCRNIQRGVHPDVQVINREVQAEMLSQDPAKKRELGVDTIRILQRDVNLKPYQGRRKVYIIDEAETLSEEAVNSFLKTLEEPPPSTIFVLLSLTEEALLPTLVSRCQVLRLRPVSRRLIEDELRRCYELEPEEAKLLASLSMGRVGWAFQAAADPRVAEARSARRSELIALESATRVRRFEYAAELAGHFGRGEREKVLETLDLWSGWWRDVVLVKGDCPHLVTNIDEMSALREAAQKYDLEQLVGFVRRVEETALQLKQNVNPRLALESVLLEVPAFAGK